MTLELDTERDAQALTEMLAGACYLGNVDFEASSPLGEISHEDAAEFHHENRNFNRLAREGRIKKTSTHSDDFLFREWGEEGEYIVGY